MTMPLLFFFSLCLFSLFSISSILSMFNYKMMILLNIFSSNSLMNMKIAMNNFNTLFTIVVSMISLLIFIYCMFYMGVSYTTPSFYWILIIFISSMLVLINSKSLNMYLLGWDGLGVSSFLLVIFYTNLMSTRSGVATFLTNRLGDFFIISSFVVMAMTGQLYLEMGSVQGTDNFYFSYTPIFLIILGGATKSAQLPFSAWLPAAMAAPTPVSALVHSSTLVTAGIYLLSMFILEMDCFFYFSMFFMGLGILLSLMAGLMAYYEMDFKKLIAMSTLSQLGILFYVLFSKNSTYTLFHIMSHATFKSLLFLVVGYLIFFNSGAQDTRLKTVSKVMMMMALSMFITSSLSLMGFIFTPGFFSKDMIILDFLPSGINMYMYYYLLIACILTVMYTLKSFLLIFNNFMLCQPNYINSVTYSLMFSMMPLYFFMLMFGLFFSFCFLDNEDYTNSNMMKVTGLMIFFMGLLLFQISKNLSLKTLISSSKKMVYEYLTQMVNMNNISNNMMSTLFKSTSLMIPLEMTWWELISEKYSTTIFSNSNKPFLKNSNLANLETVMLLIIFLLVLVMMMSF